MESWMFMAALVVTAAAIVYLGRSRRPLSRDNTLLTLGSALVVLGIIFGEDRLIGYSFLGTGVLLSIIGALTSKKGSHVWRRSA